MANSTLLGGYLATKTGQPSAVLLRSQTLGYEGSIELLIAIGASGKMLGNAWLQAFSGKSRTDPADNGWALKKDQGQFDQMVGATITSRAVINAIHDALRYFDEHQQQLIGSSAHE